MWQHFSTWKHQIAYLTFAVNKLQVIPSKFIWIILTKLENTMLYTKPQGHRSIGSGEDFQSFSPYDGLDGHICHVNWTIPPKNSVLPSQQVSIWNLFTICQVVSEEKLFENADRKHRTINSACLSYQLPWILWLRWAKKLSHVRNIRKCNIKGKALTLVAVAFRKK